MLCLSDVFTEKSHFEWMLDTLLELHKNHPQEDELVMQYLIVGICKAAAITGVVSRKLLNINIVNCKNPPVCYFYQYSLQN